MDQIKDKQVKIYEFESNCSQMSLWNSNVMKSTKAVWNIRVQASKQATKLAGKLEHY